MRLIDADAVFPWYVSNFKDMEPSDVRFSMNDIKGNLDNIPTIETTRWIPVSERLPEENGYYLTTTMYHEVYCDYWGGGCFNRTEAVIAWQPLPKAYNRGMKNDK